MLHGHQLTNLLSWLCTSQEEYNTSNKTHKMEITRRVIEHIHTLNPPGRFLEKDEATNSWRECEMKRAHEKTAQALRDGAARLRNTNKRPISPAQLTRPAKKQRINDAVKLADAIEVTAEKALINLDLHMDELMAELQSPISSLATFVCPAADSPPRPISPSPSAASASSLQSPVTFSEAGDFDDIDDGMFALPFHMVDGICMENDQYEIAPMKMGMVDMQDEDIFRLWLTCWHDIN